MTPSLGIAKSAGLLLTLLLLPWIVTAKERQWLDANVVDISYNSSNGGMATIPVGGITATVPITVNRIVYRIATQDTTYILVLVNKKHPLNLTLHGKTKVAVDGKIFTFSTTLVKTLKYQSSKRSPTSLQPQNRRKP